MVSSYVRFLVVVNLLLILSGLLPSCTIQIEPGKRFLTEPARKGEQGMVEVLYYEAIVNEENNYEVRGRIVNNSQARVISVKVTVIFYDQNNRVFRTASAYADPTILELKEKGTFKVNAMKADLVPAIANYEVRVTYEPEP
jgi:hypothetical protein